MTEIKIFTQHVAVLFVIIINLISVDLTTISNKRLCFDPKCSEPVSLAKTLMPYHPNVPGILGFKANVEVKVYSKSAGNRTDLWGVEINGIRGYVPQNMIREYKILRKNLTFEVSTESHRETNSPEKDAFSENSISQNTPDSQAQSTTKNNADNVPSLDQVSPSYEVIDGTTFHFSPRDETPESSNYATQSVHDALETDEQPILSVHPSIVSSTLSFVSSVFESVTESTKALDEDDDEDEESEEEEKLEINAKTDNTPVQENAKVETLEKENKEEVEHVKVTSNSKNGEEIISETDSLDVINNTEKQEKEKSVTATIESSTNVEKMVNQTLSESKIEESILLDTLPPSVDTITITEKTTSPVIEVKMEVEIPKANDTLKNEVFEDVTNKVEEESLNEEIQKLENVTDEVEDSGVFTNETDGGYIYDKTGTDSGTLENGNITFDTTEAFKISAEEIVQDSSSKTVDDNLPTESLPTISDTSAKTIEKLPSNNMEHHLLEETQLPDSSQINVATEKPWTVNELLNNRNLLNVEEDIQYTIDEPNIERPEVSNIFVNDDQNLFPNNENNTSTENISNEDMITTNVIKEQVLPSEVYDKDHTCSDGKEDFFTEDNEKINETKNTRNYWESVLYVSITAFTTLLFSLGYYYIENTRRDSRLIEKINKLEKELMISTKECTILDESLKSTSMKLNSIEDESFGSNEMVVSLKAELEASKKTNMELEDQVATLEKELETASEAGLELERMLREVLSANSDDNPLAQSIEDLQTRLNAQQAANESLTNALNLKVQENETLFTNYADVTKKCEQLESDVNRLSEELKTQTNLKIYMEQNLSDQVKRLELQLKNVLEEKSLLRKQLTTKEHEVKELSDVVKQYNANNLNFEKLYDVAHVKAEVTQLLEERNEYKMKLSEVEGAHNLLEEHVKIVEEQIAIFGEQCKLAEKEKKDAETRLEVLSNYFKEKEAQRQKEEALWLEKQGEVSSTVERLQTLQNEIHSYKQQIEMLKREIVDQEKEYKSQISALETKSHEHWVMARQNERRLEESKVESSQLRNRLTLIEKNLNDIDPEAKLHRLEANGETATSPSLFLGAESSSSPVMFAGASGVPPPPPSYMYGPPFPPFLPPPPHTGSGMHPYDVGQRPPPLGGRLSSPPPMHMQPPVPGRYDNTGSPPPPLSPPLPHPYGRHRSPPPPPHFGNDHIPPPPPTLLPMPLGTSHSWGEESLPHIRNSGFSATSQHQREQRPRNHKGSLHSSGDSLDNTHHSGKV